MPLLAVTVTDNATNSVAALGLIFIILAIVTAGYLLGCWLYPFGNCRRCKGSGKRRSPFGRSFALCRKCHGDGRRLRVGRRILNSLRELHDKGTR
ncbi:hypothetical protein [Actinoplanes subtropicus]|uniref:hypothetical protein n=1 Tax=Actinoplanes subtropicus TaxID=543632 RepID=UPI000691EAA9|nr:hypothetical protein [Actinoplanes subtropicus]